MGDIRFGGQEDGGLANFPSGGGDITLGRQYFLNAGRQASTWSPLRALVFHELGHSLSFIHFSPAIRAQQMEAALRTNFDGLSQHERRALCRNYDDRFFPNMRPDLAHEFTDIFEKSSSIIELDLSLNLVPGCAGRVIPDPDVINPTPETNFVPPVPPPVINVCNTNTADDWFKFTVAPNRSVHIVVNPTGGDYWWTRGQTSTAAPA